MEERVCLEINVLTDYVAPQFMKFPLVVLRADQLSRNWLYQNYIMPVARLDGVNSLTCDVADAITYGAGGNVHGKIMRLNSINRAVCAQLRDIVSALRENISKEYYCVLFLDFYYLSCAEMYYGKYHYIHEMLLYGYDNRMDIFFCYGYFERLYQQITLSYKEVEKSFSSALQYIGAMDGWEEYMLITMRKFGHEMPSPYDNEFFLGKLEAYVSGKATEQFQYDNLMYLKPSECSVSCAGRRINEIFLEYINMLMELSDTENLDERIDSQITAFNVFKCCHNDMAERLAFFVERNGGEQALGDFVREYQNNVVRKSTEIRLAYIKFLCLMEKKLPVDNVLKRMQNELSELDRHEEEILNGFLNEARRMMEGGQQDRVRSIEVLKQEEG